MYFTAKLKLVACRERAMVHHHPSEHFSGALSFEVNCREMS